MRKLILTTSIIGMALPLWSHSGHGITESFPAHYLTSPWHVATMSAILFLLVCTFLLLKRRQTK